MEALAGAERAGPVARGRADVHAHLNNLRSAKAALERALTLGLPEKQRREAEDDWASPRPDELGFPDG